MCSCKDSSTNNEPISCVGDAQAATIQANINIYAAYHHHGNT